MRRTTEELAQARARVETKRELLWDQRRELIDVRTRLENGAPACDCCGSLLTDASKRRMLETLAVMLGAVDVDLRYFAARRRQILRLQHLEDELAGRGIARGRGV
jgi:hypothetical protein